MEKNIEKMENETEKSMPLASSNFSISWTGSPSASNSAIVETRYNGNKLEAQVVADGTPTWDAACSIKFTPQNCQLKSGNPNEEITIDSLNFNQTFLVRITPTDAYIGKNVQFIVTVRGLSGNVVYVRGSIA